jgi:uncharacterized protein (DUF2147 family)
MRSILYSKLLILLMYFSGIAFAGIKHNIVGYWETIDDRTGQKKAIVKIEEINHQFVGKIVKVYWKDKDHKRCDACHGRFKNQPIEGLNFLWGLEYHSPDLYMNGHIIDPHNGQVYQVRVKKQHRLLLVRGYLGLPLLGRTQVWHRYHGVVE